MHHFFDNILNFQPRSANQRTHRRTSSGRYLPRDVTSASARNNNSGNTVKSVKQQLGELYGDYKYLDTLLEEEG